MPFWSWCISATAGRRAAGPSDAPAMDAAERGGRSAGRALPPRNRGLPGRSRAQVLMKFCSHRASLMSLNVRNRGLQLQPRILCFEYCSWELPPVAGRFVLCGRWRRGDSARGDAAPSGAMAGYIGSTNQVFGGDEVGAMVLDMGGTTTRCGYGGEEGPRTVISSTVGFLPEEAGEAKSKEVDGGAAKAAKGAAKGAAKPRMKTLVDQQLGLPRAGLELRPALVDGVIEDWDAVERLWHHALVNTLRVNTAEHPLLLSEPTHTTAEIRAKTVQLMFEKHAPPAVYLANNAVLTSFAFGRPTSVVLKSGGTTTSAVPVYEGHVMTKGLTRSTITGDSLADLLMQTLQSGGAAPRPRTTIVRRESPAGSGTFAVSDVDPSLTSASFRAYWMRDLAKDVKTRCCRTSLYPHLIAVSEDVESYVMPDGSAVDVKADLVWGLAEKLFTREGETPGAPGSAESKLTGIGPTGVTPTALAFPDLVEHAVNKVDVDLKRELYGNLIVSGGNTLWPGFSQRLGRILGARLPQRVKVKIHTPSTVRTLLVPLPTSPRCARCAHHRDRIAALRRAR